MAKDFGSPTWILAFGDECEVSVVMETIRDHVVRVVSVVRRKVYLVPVATHGSSDTFFSYSIGITEKENMRIKPKS